MTIDEFIDLMDFPPQWRELDMLDRDYLEMCVARYRRGHEDAPEHDRHGHFQFWLKREPSREVLMRLATLSFVDPDPHMAAHVRADILRSPNCDAEVEEFVRSGGVD